MKIPKIAILCVTTTAACQEPLFGDWDLNEICYSQSGQEECDSFPQSYADGSSISLVMTIESDWTGGMEQTFTGESSGTYTFPVEAEKKAANSYEIEIEVPGSSLSLDCTLASTALDCETAVSGVSAEYRFTKQQ